MKIFQLLKSQRHEWRNAQWSQIPLHQRHGQISRASLIQRHEHFGYLSKIWRCLDLKHYFNFPFSIWRVFRWPMYGIDAQSPQMNVGSSIAQQIQSHSVQSSNHSTRTANRLRNWRTPKICWMPNRPSIVWYRRAPIRMVKLKRDCIKVI